MAGSGAPGRATVDEYVFGEVRVDGRGYRDDLIVLPQSVHCPWWRKRGHRLQMVDLEEVLTAQPDVLVVGTGYFGRMRVDRSVEAEFARLGIALVAAPTAEAIQRFGALAADQTTILAIHLTC